MLAELQLAGYAFERCEPTLDDSAILRVIEWRGEHKLRCRVATVWIEGGQRARFKAYVHGVDKGTLDFRSYQGAFIHVVEGVWLRWQEAMRDKP